MQAAFWMSMPASCTTSNHTERNLVASPPGYLWNRLTLESTSKCFDQCRLYTGILQTWAEAATVLHTKAKIQGASCCKHCQRSYKGYQHPIDPTALYRRSFGKTQLVHLLDAMLSTVHSPYNRWITCPRGFTNFISFVSKVVIVSLASSSKVMSWRSPTCLFCKAATRASFRVTR